MSLLLTFVPYIASIGLFVATHRRLFAERLTPAPKQWRWMLAGPVVVAALTPVSIAATPELSASSFKLLFVSIGISLLFVVATMALTNDYNRLFRPLRLPFNLATSFPAHKLLGAVGVAVVVISSLINVAAAGA